MNGPRVVSLLPSATETVVALGLEECLVGRSHECDYPARIASLPVCSRPRIDVRGTSAEVDRRVKDALHAGLSLYEVDVPRLRELRPDVILTQVLCNVCAVSLDDVETALADELGYAPRLVALEPHTLDDVWADIGKVAESLQTPTAGECLVRELTTRLQRLQASASTGPRPRLLCLEWLDPLMAAGNWVPELVSCAGGEAILGVAGAHSPWITWDEVRIADPDFLLAVPCGWNIEKARQELAPWAARDDWGDLRAVQSGHVYVADGNSFLNRPGPRLLESALLLCGMFADTIAEGRLVRF